MTNKQTDGQLDEKMLHETNSYDSHDDVVLVDDTDELYSLAQRAGADSFVFLLCSAGLGTVYFNGKSYDVNKGDLFVGYSGVLFERFDAGKDFKCCCLLSWFGFVDSMSAGAARTWNVKMFSENYPVVALGDDMSSLFLKYWNLLRLKLDGQPGVHRRKIIGLVFEAFLYEFNDMVESEGLMKYGNHTSAEKLFKRFIGELDKSYPKHRSVSYYAGLLCISPKYLSWACKSVSGKTAMEIINGYVICDIKTLLRNPNKTIKEISYELDFNNVSFFGKYVRKMIGMSPRAYRKQSISENER